MIGPVVAVQKSLIRFLCFGVAGISSLCAVTAPLFSQDTPHGEAAILPEITFTLDFPQSSPEHYWIAVDAAGHVRYECNGKVDKDAEEEMYRVEFEMSPQNRAKLFEWTKQAQYFSGTLDAGDNRLAFTGTKILSYQDKEKSNSARFNYSKLEPVRQITALFQNMAATLEHGRRLAYYHQYQKLALDEELKQMQAEAKAHGLAEIQGVAPVLREIAEDTSVMNVVRARAQELVQMGGVAVH